MSDAPAWVTPFLRELETTGVIARAARNAGINASQVHARKQNDADFAAAVDEALELAADVMEQEAHRRAVRGVDEPIVYQGQLTPVWERALDGSPVYDIVEVEPAKMDPTGAVVIEPAKTVQRPRQLVIDGVPQFLTVRKYSDPLLMFLLKGRRRNIFGDKTELTGANGAPLAVAVDDTTKSARIAALMALAAQRKDASDIC